jgi:hypothetical protein
MENLHTKIINIRQMALEGQVAAIEKGDVDSSIMFQKIGRKLDQLLRSITQKENK